jgi:hypothetical protein
MMAVNDLVVQRGFELTGVEFIGENGGAPVHEVGSLGSFEMPNL